jgi:hypothetical protein
VSVIINAVDSEDTHYLLLDATREEFDSICSLDPSLDLELSIMLNNQSYTYRPKKLIRALQDILELPTGIVGKHIESMLVLADLDDIEYLEISYDSSEPTSDYRAGEDAD